MRIPSLFDTPDPAFSLYQFEKGERLDTLNPEEYLSFLVDGSIEISANRADGLSYRSAISTALPASAIWNSAENAMITHQIEARTTALCIVLPLASHERASAERQPLFTISFKLCHRKADALFQLPVEFFHARGILPLLSLRALSGSDVFRRGKMAMQLHCSRRQLQRVLKKLLEEGQLVKLSKGSYRLS